MDKSDLNSSMLFKLRDKGLCIMLQRERDSYNVFYSKEQILKGSIGGESSLEADYDENLITIGDYSTAREYDIVAIKQYESCPQALHNVLNDKEPNEWDWVEEVKESQESEEEKFNVMNLTLNITIDPNDARSSIDNFLEELRKHIKIS